jgi:hypothetical protein
MRFLILILIILSIFGFIYIYNFFKDTLYDLYTNYHEYRLGDVYNGDAGKINDEYLYKHHTEKYPNSIAAEYLKKTKERNNIKIMHDIVKKRLKNIPTHKCVIHIRIGDVLEDLKSDDIKKEWYKDHSDDHKGNFFDKIKYLRTKKYFQEKIDKLLKLNINLVTIICGAHHKYNKYKNSSMYLDMIIDLLKKNGIDCNLSLKNNPDKDILLGVAAEYFINTGGGFSRLIKEIRSKNGKLPAL